MCIRDRKQSGEFKSVKYAACSMQGWRTGMEDAHIIYVDQAQEIYIFGVFDGHGGKEVAKFVEKHFVEELQKNKNFIEKNFEQALKENFSKIDELLGTVEGKKELMQVKNGQEDEKLDQGFQQESYAGCTANVIILYQNKLYVANAGDSRSVLSSQGKVVELSQDHKPDLDKEKERIKNAGGFIADGRINGNLNLSRAIGDLEYKKNKSLSEDQQLIISVPDIKVHSVITEDEFFLIGCDGIFEVKTNQEIIDFIRDKLIKKEKLEDILCDLLEWIVALDTVSGFGCDNMTSILITLKDL
eukprot:TRINITY_DN8545_c0_g1_i2.p1 TRINITY_DN8545_c0_g1~~TRINITY_DN8545_c0_g1_i2.p1  ORF type:complete len:300 (+),score=67.86 TRINITY_DN8545_c0_g1_i2:125-1024(+)